VSVIVLNYNNKKYLGPCIDSVLKSDYPNLELVFVDNASSDGSTDFVKKRFGSESSLKIVQNSENLGYAGGNNVGVDFATGEYLVFLNNDTEVDRNWLCELVTVMESDRNIGAAQGKLISTYNRKRFDNVGGFIDRLGFSILRGLQEEDEGQYDKCSEIFFAIGAAFAVRRNVLNEVGLFDYAYFLYYEDVDLCWRIQLRGYKIVFVPKCVVFHAGGASSRKERLYKNLPEYHKHKNHITTLLKNYELFNLIRYMPVAVFLEVLSDFVSFKSDRFVRIRGIIYNIGNFDKIWKKRIEVQKKIRKKKDIALFEKGLILPFNLKLLKANLKRLKVENERS